MDEQTPGADAERVIEQVDGREPDPTELDDPAAGNPDREAGRDSPRQRPISDNKAGG